MKHPNGYGSVVKLSGTRRNPFAVRKTVGWNDKKHPVYKTIGYFPTREAGLMALAEYNKNPYDVDIQKTTLNGLYALWVEKKFSKLGESNRSRSKTAFKHCADLHNTKYRDIKAYHMQDVIDNCGKGYATQLSIKNLFYHLDRFALELDLIDRSYSSLTTTASAEETNKKPFTEEEIKRLWEMQDVPWVDSVLMFLYTGFRISELLDLQATNIDLDAGLIRGGMKTEAGKNRLVPIHSKIAGFVRQRMSAGTEYLFAARSGRKITTVWYYEHWYKIMKQAGMNHTPHECRHTLRSRLDSLGANKRCIDLIMGHKSSDVGLRVYTHKTIQELKETMELIKD
jgi:integrase